MPVSRQSLSRRTFLAGSAAATLGLSGLRASAGKKPKKAQVAITLDFEMSRNFPTWKTTHWDYEKGNLNEPTKKYAVEACRRVKARGGVIHCFLVGRVLEQESVAWLEEISREGHPIGNHTYDHVYVLAKRREDIQYRFKRAPWLIAGKTIPEVLHENIAITTLALKERTGIEIDGFRTPGGFRSGLDGREDIQKMLLDLGFRWVSAKYPPHANSRPREKPSEAVLDSIVKAQAAAQPYLYPTGLVEIPMSPISDIGGFRSGRWQLEWFLEAIRRGLAWAIESGAVFDFLAHPSCIGVTDPKFRCIDLICDMVEAAGDRAELVDLGTIARRFH